jgi:hypothetical protein
LKHLLQLILGALAVGSILWAIANYFMLRVLMQVNQKLTIAEQPCPNALSPSFCVQLWQRHKRFYPDNSLRNVWLSSYAVSILSYTAAFTLFILKPH